MSLDICFTDLVQSGKIPAEKLEGASARYARMVGEYQSTMGKSAAEALATDKVIKWLERDIFQRNLDRLRMAKKQGAWLADMKIKSTGDVLDSKVAVSKLVRIDKQMDAVRNSHMAALDGFLAKFRRNVLGVVRDKSELEPIGRAIFGEKIDDINASEMAQGIAQAFENTRLMRNSVGGYIGKIDNYLPQSHDPRAVRGAGDYGNWRDFGPIERVKVMDHETGEFLTGLAREDRLRAIYESIVTESANSLTPGAVGKGSLANARSDPRSLHFENYDDWAEYNAQFGTKDSLYDIVVGHISSMSRDIALMDALGPNPEAMIRFQKEHISKSIGMKGSEKVRKKEKALVDELGHIYDELTGANKATSNERLALGFSALRAVQVSAKLGSAILSVAPDFATLIKTSHYNRIPIAKTLARYVKLWNPADDGDRRLAVRLGLLIDDWMTLTSSTARLYGEELTGEFSRRLADAIIRGQGIARHTRNGQWAFGMEFLSHLTQMKDRGFASLDPAMQNAMARYDIGESQWDAYRSTPVQFERGADWIFPGDTQDAKIGQRFLEMVLSESEYAIITPDVRTRALISSKLESGTWLGEIGKSALLFKSFPIAMYNLHGRRMLEQAGIENKAIYGLTLMTMLVAGGALSAQLKTINAGKDPMPMDDQRFWVKASLQGGGLGIAGDLLYNSENSFGGGPLQTLAGPIMGQLLTDVASATAGNIGKALDGDEATKTDFTKDAVKLVNSNLPGQNLVYARLANEMTWKRLLREWADPDIADADERVRARAEAEGTAMWADPSLGVEGMRAPDLGNAWQGGDEADGGDALQYLSQ